MPSTTAPLPHRRYNPLLREWVLVSPQRTQRPWQGETTPPITTAGPSYDPACYLCPGNARSGGQQNPSYTGVFAFNNDFPALLPDTPEQNAPAPSASPLLISEPERGICRVLCFHPDHSLTLARMALPDIARVVDAWVDETAALSEVPWINHVQVFENRGAIMGASNPHPHCQIWATEHVPDQPLRELAAQQAYTEEHHSCLLCDYLKTELTQAGDAAQNRIVCENDAFVALVPYWAVWPFETLVLPRRHLSSFLDLTTGERAALAHILKAVTTRYDNLFQVSFPYTMGFHQRPVRRISGKASHDALHFHAHFYPPLLRSAEVRKFMVGFEMLGMPQRDLTPETAAARLRALPEKHYTE